MTGTLERAIAAVTALPADDQEMIGRRLLVHVERLGRLRTELDKAACSLDAGKGGTFRVEDFVRQRTR
jgi:hypothetical protein